MQEVIKVEKLSKSYHGKEVLSDLNLSIQSGTVFGLLGANGAGKSTSIECMLGTKKADEGTSVILEMDPVAKRKQLFEHSASSTQRITFDNDCCFPSIDTLHDPVSIVDVTIHVVFRITGLVRMK